MSSVHPFIANRSYDPAVTGYRITYHREDTNHCPGCGKSQWLLGRVSAQCAFCATSLPFADSTAFSQRSLLYAA